MASFNFTVDTSPMASSLSSVSAHVSETTIAVAAMQAAVIAEEKAAAERLCENIDSGFFGLMQSQLTMKKTEHLSNLKAKFLTLKELGKDLASKQGRMESDVARIQREYYKLFHSIDKALEKRIQNLDQDAYWLAEQRKNFIVGRQLKDISEVVFYEKDTSTIARTALAAKLKKRTSKMLDIAGNNVQQNLSYQNHIKNILEPAKATSQIQELMPVICAIESSMVMPGAAVTSIQTPTGLDGAADNNVRSAIGSRLNDLLSSAPLAEDEARVDAEYRKLVSNSGLDTHTAEIMISLYENGGTT